MKNSLPSLGTPIKMTIIEPWDLVTSIGSGPFNAILTNIKQNKIGKIISIVIKLEQSIIINNNEYYYLVGSPRHEGRSVEEVFIGKQVAFSFTMITESRASGEDPFDLSWWRGGNAIIADVII